MRAVAMLALGLFFVGCLGDGVEARPDRSVKVSQLVQAAKSKCEAEAKGADPNQVPGAFEVCIARAANAAPQARREAICKLAVGWRGFIAKGMCYIDAE